MCPRHKNKPCFCINVTQPGSIRYKQQHHMTHMGWSEDKNYNPFMTIDRLQAMALTFRNSAGASGHTLQWLQVQVVCEAFLHFGASEKGRRSGYRTRFYSRWLRQRKAACDANAVLDCVHDECGCSYIPFAISSSLAGHPKQIQWPHPPSSAL